MNAGTICVSPNGDDRANGTRQTPLLTAHAALVKVRERRQAGQCGLTVEFGPGTHNLTTTFLVDSWPTTRDGQPLRLVAAEGAHPVLTSVVVLGHRRPAGDTALPCSPTARGRLWQIDIPPGHSVSALHVNGRPCRLARSPKHDRWEEWPVCCPGPDDRQLRIPEPLRCRHTHLQDITINFLSTPYTKWINYTGHVEAVDGDIVTVSHSLVPNRYLKPDDRIPFRFENVLAALTEPGEWCVDTNVGVIYLWPPDGVSMADADITVPGLATLLLLQAGPDQPLGHIEIDGLTFRGTSRSDRPSAAAVELHDTHDCELRNCLFEDLGGAAVACRGTTTGTRIQGCRITGCDGAGITISAPGPLRTPHAGHNCIEDNDIRDCGRHDWHAAAIRIAGSGHNVVRNNRLSNLPYAGITVGGARLIFFLTQTAHSNSPAVLCPQDIDIAELTPETFKPYVAGHNRIEDNLVADTMQRLDDGAAIYCHASHHNILRGNTVLRTKRNRSHGLYFDDDEVLSLMEGNCIIDCPLERGDGGSAIHVHDNAKNTIRRNRVEGAGRVFTFPASYGGHTVEENTFNLTAPPLRPILPARNSGRYQEIRWDAGENVFDRNVYRSPNGGEWARELLQMLREHGVEPHGVSEGT